MADVPPPQDRGAGPGGAARPNPWATEVPAVAGNAEGRTLSRETGVTKPMENVSLSADTPVGQVAGKGKPEVASGTGQIAGAAPNGAGKPGREAPANRGSKTGGAPKSLPQSPPRQIANAPPDSAVKAPGAPAQPAAASAALSKLEELHQAGRLPWITVVPAWLISLVFHMILVVVLAMTLVPLEVKEQVRELLAIRTNDLDAVEALVADELNPDEELRDTSGVEEPMAIDLSQDVLERLDTQSLEAMPGALAEISAGGMSLDEASAGDLLASVEKFGVAGLGQGLGGTLAGRGQGMRQAMIRREGGTPASEAAVGKALAWLATHQRRDGSWSFDHRVGPCQGRCGNEGTSKYNECTVAATAMALLPFLGAGQTHKEGEYKRTVERGLYFLSANMVLGPNGADCTQAHAGGDMYSQGLAAITLCEAFAMTQDKHLYAPAQAAVNFIVYAQDPARGGWWYQPRAGGDTSVVGWQLMALKSGSMAGLFVPASSYRGANGFLDLMQGDDGASYGYMESAQFAAAPATSAAGLLCRMYLGWPREHPALAQGVEMLVQRGPDPQNLYYDYYATQVVHHFGGEQWKRWNTKMRDQLVETQSQEKHEAGSWFNGDIYAAQGGRLYCTCMSAMILEVYYRHMPLYDEGKLEAALQGDAQDGKDSEAPGGDKGK